MLPDGWVRDGEVTLSTAVRTDVYTQALWAHEAHAILTGALPGPPVFNRIQALNSIRVCVLWWWGGASQRSEKGLQANNMREAGVTQRNWAGGWCYFR